MPSPLSPLPFVRSLVRRARRVPARTWVVVLLAAVVVAAIVWQQRKSGKEGLSVDIDVANSCRMGQNIMDLRRTNASVREIFKSGSDADKAAVKDLCKQGRSARTSADPGSAPSTERCAAVVSNGKTLKGKLCNVAGLKKMMPCQGGKKGECCDYWANCMDSSAVQSTQHMLKQSKGSSKVVLYSDTNYRGESLAIDDTMSPANEARNLKAWGWANKISSIKIKGGKYRVTLYKGRDGEGNSITLSKNEPELGVYSDVTGEKSDRSVCGNKSNNGCWNDTASSIKLHA